LFFNIEYIMHLSSTYEYKNEE
jgi:hypothetical protein